jgi:hypothetical protein
MSAEPDVGTLCRPVPTSVDPCQRQSLLDEQLRDLKGYWKHPTVTAECMSLFAAVDHTISLTTFVATLAGVFNEFAAVWHMLPT